MPNQNWQSALNFGAPWSSTSGTALTASTTETIITPGFPGSLPDFMLPAQYWYPGKQARLTLAGVYSWVATPGTMTVKFLTGTEATAPASQTVYLNSGAFTPSAVVTTAMWRAEAVLRCRSYASATNANVMSIGELKFFSGTLSSSIVMHLPWGQSGIAAPADVSMPNSTSAFVFATCTWGTSNANSIQVHDYLLEDLT